MAMWWNPQSKLYRTKQWYGTDNGNQIGLRTPTGYITIEHDKTKNILLFYCDGLSTTPFKNLKQLSTVLMSPTDRIFLEWCQEETGSYLYFDLYKVTQKVQTWESMDVRLLSRHGDMDDNPIDKSCYFDESVSIESQLEKTDTLIVSPLRSILARYTPMGIYNGHQLYLGPIPTLQFTNQFKIKYIFNCCQKKNIDALTQNTKARERVFNVASWKWHKAFSYTPLTTDNEQKSNDKVIKMSNMEYLDTMIDEIHLNLERGNIIIHCLAGAHRSPFITGCYLYKYGLKGPHNTPQDIYKHLKQKRSIVQELGYDKQLGLYQQYLKDKHPHSKTE